MTKADSDLLTALQEWYHSNCDGDWEHEFGIKIQNLDNPGWTVSIPITGTPLESRAFSTVEWRRGADDWINCSVNDEAFNGHGGSRNLVDIIRVFIGWVRA